MVYTVLNRQCRCSLIHWCPPRTHVSNRHELHLVYPSPTNPHGFHRLDRRVRFSWQRCDPFYLRCDIFEEGYSKFTAFVSFLFSLNLSLERWKIRIIIDVLCF